MTELPAKTLNRMAALLMHGDIEIVDCSAVLGPQTPVEPLPGDDTGWDVEIHKISEYDADGPFFAWNWLLVGEHAGTHVEAPRAWAPDAADTDALDPGSLIGPACIIDCSADCAADPGFLLTEAHVRSWEAVHGAIPAGAWVLMRSDWDARSDDRDAFLNAGIHPGPAPEALRYLLERDIAGWGTQCVSPDSGLARTMTPPWPARRMLAQAGRPTLASLAALDRLPPTGALLVVTPLRLVNGTGSPARVLAMVPRGNQSV